MPAWTRPQTLPLGPVAWATLVLVGLGGIAPPRIQAQAQPPGQPASTPGDAAARTAITKVLTDQTTAWNQGNLDAFLEGYWRSPQVVFLSGGTRNDGFDAMRDRYRKRYQSEGKAMGQLTFPDLEIEPLGPMPRSSGGDSPDHARRDPPFGPVHPDHAAVRRRLEDHPRPHLGRRDRRPAARAAIPPAAAAPRPRPPR